MVIRSLRGDPNRRSSSLKRIEGVHVEHRSPWRISQWIGWPSPLSGFLSHTMWSFSVTNFDHDATNCVSTTQHLALEFPNYRLINLILYKTCCLMYFIAVIKDRLIHSWCENLPKTEMVSFLFQNGTNLNRSNKVLRFLKSKLIVQCLCGLAVWTANNDQTRQ